MSHFLSPYFARNLLVLALDMDTKQNAHLVLVGSREKKKKTISPIIERNNVHDHMNRSLLLVIVPDHHSVISSS